MKNELIHKLLNLKMYEEERLENAIERKERIEIRLVVESDRLSDSDKELCKSMLQDTTKHIEHYKKEINETNKLIEELEGNVNEAVGV